MTTDDGRSFSLIARTAPLSASHLDSFQRVRRLGWIGDSDPQTVWSVIFRVLYRNSNSEQ